jgi:hypothetical protein
MLHSRWSYLFNGVSPELLPRPQLLAETGRYGEVHLHRPPGDIPGKPIPFILLILCKLSQPFVRTASRFISVFATTVQAASSARGAGRSGRALRG